MTTAAPTLAAEPTTAASGWTGWHLIGTLVLAGFGVWATSDAWRDLISSGWNDREQSHIFLIPLIAAWLVYVRRARLRKVRPVGQWIGPPAVAAGWFMYWYGGDQMRYWTWQIGALAIVVGSALTVLGTDVLRRFLPAFLVLLFVCPLPTRLRQKVTIPLQAASARATQAVFGVVGTGLERSGNLLTINGVQVSVAEACSGMRMTIALTLVAFAFAFAAPLTPLVRAVVILASPLLAVTCNVIRLVPTVWAYGHLATDTADVVHELGGWVMLLIAYVLLTGSVRAAEWAGLRVYRNRVEGGRA